MSRLPLESILLLIGVTIEGLYEIIVGYNIYYDSTTQQMSMYQPESLHHIVMDLLFFIVGLTAIFNHYSSSLPEHIDTVTAVLAFGSSAFLFYFHDHGGDATEVQVHLYLAIALGIIAFCFILEIVQENKKIYATLMRGYFTLVAGGWYYSMAFILYGSSSYQYVQGNGHHSHLTSMLIAFYFILNVALALIALFVIAAFAYRISGRTLETGVDWKRSQHDDVRHTEETDQLVGTHEEG